jgi:hydrogenase-4 component F
VVFVGMGRTVLAMVQGQPSPEAERTRYQDGLLTGLPVVASMAIVLLLGLHVPAPLEQLLRDAAAYLEWTP